MASSEKRHIEKLSCSAPPLSSLVLQLEADGDPGDQLPTLGNISVSVACLLLLPRGVLAEAGPGGVVLCSLGVLLRHDPLLSPLSLSTLDLEEEEEERERALLLGRPGGEGPGPGGPGGGRGLRRSWYWSSEPLLRSTARWLSSRFSCFCSDTASLRSSSSCCLRLNSSSSCRVSSLWRRCCVEEEEEVGSSTSCCWNDKEEEEDEEEGQARL